MLLFVAFAVLAALVALVRGGSLRALAETHFHAPWLLFAGLALQLGAQIWSPDWLAGRRGTAVIVISNLAVVAFLAANRRLPGVVLVAIGLSVNVLVIALNGAMPVSVAASRNAGVEPPPVASPDVEHERLGDDTELPWLADVLAVPQGKQVFSVGDVILGLGVAELVYARARSGRRRHRAATGPATSD